jgi:hypothetical protein
MIETIQSHDTYRKVMERIYALLDKSDLHRDEAENLELQQLCAAAERYEQEHMGLEPNTPSESVTPS